MKLKASKEYNDLLYMRTACEQCFDRASHKLCAVAP